MEQRQLCWLAGCASRRARGTNVVSSSEDFVEVGRRSVHGRLLDGLAKNHEVQKSRSCQPLV